MPQTGHGPGVSRTIWGCIGQVHSVRGPDAALRAIPRPALADLRVHRTGVHPIGGRHAVTVLPGRPRGAAITAGQQHPMLAVRALPPG